MSGGDGDEVSSWGIAQLTRSHASVGFGVLDCLVHERRDKSLTKGINL